MRLIVIGRGERRFLCGKWSLVGANGRSPLLIIGPFARTRYWLLVIGLLIDKQPNFRVYL